MLAMVCLVIWAIWRHSKDKRKWAADQLAEQRIRAEEERQPYLTAWRNATAAQDVPSETLVQCGDYLIKAAERWTPQDVGLIADEVYRHVLRQLKARPELRPAALTFGRRAYAASRPHHILTVYDEQAIQNDILAHS